MAKAPCRQPPRGITRHGDRQVNATLNPPRSRSADPLHPRLIVARRVIMAQRQCHRHSVHAPTRLFHSINSAPVDALAESLLANLRSGLILGCPDQPQRLLASHKGQVPRLNQRPDRFAYVGASSRKALDIRITRRCKDTATQVHGHRVDRHHPLIRLHLEGERGDAVPEIGKLQILEHGVGNPTVRRRVGNPLRRSDQRVRRLILGPQMQPKGVQPGLEVPRRPAQQIAVRPDPPHRTHPARRQRNGKARRIAVAGDARPPLAAAAPVALLLEVGRPDHRSRRTHGAKEFRDLRAIARRLQLQFVQPPALPPLGLEQHRLVKAATDQPPDRPAQWPANGGAERRQH